MKARRLAFVTAAFAAVTQGQITSFESSSETWLQSYQMAMGMVGGAAVADVDHDGDHDVFLASGLDQPSQLLLNRGDGTFDVKNIPDRQPHNDRAGLWLDYDGDSDLDLLVLTDNHRQPSPTEATNLRLYRNDLDTAVRLTEVTGEAGLAKMLQDVDALPAGDLSHASGLVAADFNSDGAIDFYVTFWEGRNYLFLNNANGTFRDGSAASGIQSHTTYWQPGVHDFDGDGDMDIVQPVDFTHNKFFINNGDGTFVDRAPQLGLDNAWNDMGIAIGDPDNDQDFDIFITNIHDAFTPLSDLAGRHNVYYRNESTAAGLSFVEASEQSRLDRGDWGWGCTFVDVDHDGWQDVAQTNGFNVNSERGFATDRTRLFLNLGGGTLFSDVAPETGLDDDRIGACFVALDADSDGDQDLLQTCRFQPASLMLNRLEQTGNQYGWIRIRPRMVTAGASGHANHFAVGAVVRVTTPDASIGVQSRLISAGTSLLGQEAAEAHFGLGAAAIPGSTVAAIVEWPDGRVTSYDALPTRMRVTVVDATRSDADIDGDGALTSADVRAAERTAFDITGDLIYDRADIRRVDRLVRLSELRRNMR
ncbi:MAG: CRTAC1 family protein [Planctomycetota bacterium]